MRTLPLLFGGLAAFSACAGAAPLQTFSIDEPLAHPWSDEVVHFPFDVPDGPGSLVLADAQGQPVSWQFTDLKRAAKKQRIRGNVWTVAGLAPGARVQWQLLRKPNAQAKQPKSDLSVSHDEMAELVNPGNTLRAM